MHNTIQRDEEYKGAVIHGKKKNGSTIYLIRVSKEEGIGMVERQYSKR